jgi:hypothetical protein
MAISLNKDNFGELIDPFGGRTDLLNGILRHTSLAFVEDPVRVLRVARFAARYSDFKVAIETKKLMVHMAQIGELNHLVPERVFKEVEKAAKLTQAAQEAVRMPVKSNQKPTKNKGLLSKLTSFYNRLTGKNKKVSQKQEKKEDKKQKTFTK